VNVVVANISHFQQGITEELMLDGQLSLYCQLWHLIAGLATMAALPRPGEAVWRAGTGWVMLSTKRPLVVVKLPMNGGLAPHLQGVTSDAVKE